MRSSRTIFLLIAALTALAGCGYNNNSNSNSSGYQWKSVYRQDIRTVAVPIFKSTVYERGVEFSLSKALVQQIEANTPYKVVPRERADTILEGEIVTVDIHTLSNDRFSAIPQEQLLDITVDFTWKDLRTGKILVSRRGVEQTATFYPTLGEGRATGTQAASERLALSIVQELQADW
jgi:outer membrane lipopolysaccharide assembly protein LptE/RlpB